MDDFVPNEGKGPDNRSNNDNGQDPVDFSLFDISTSHSPPGKPNNIGTSAGPCHDNSHKTKTDSRNDNSYANCRIPASDTTPTAKEQTLEESLKLIQVDLDYTLRTWLEEGVKERPWTAFHRRT